MGRKRAEVVSRERNIPSDGSARPHEPMLLPHPIPILCYHSIGNDVHGSIAPFAVGPDQLARQLDLVVAGGYSAVTVSGLVDLLEHDIERTRGTVAITFDDGFDDNRTVAAPMLEARGLPATVFVTTGFLPGCPTGPAGRPPGSMIDWSNLVDLEAAGIEVGSHAHTHRQLDVLSRSDAHQEIRQSKDLLEAALGHPVLSFAYPHGYASGRVQRDVHGCGFRSACGVRNAFSHILDNRWLLARLTVRATTTGEEVQEWLCGSGALLATPGEQLRTKGWRVARRASAMRAAVAAKATGRQ